MVTLTRYDGGPLDVTEFDNPSVELVGVTIDAMDNDERTGFDLLSSDRHKTLYVVGGYQGRVVVRYHDSRENPDFSWSTLLDLSYDEDNTDEIEMSYNDQSEPTLLRHTVLKEVAKRVATYFAEHEALPEDLAWQGSLSRDV